jgi:hypothetical protein
MKTMRSWTLGRTAHGARASLAGLLLVAASMALLGCEAPEGDPMEDMPKGEAMDRPMEGMEEGMELDPQMMQRHAEEAEAMARQVRDHADAVGDLPPEAQRERMTGHAQLVGRMLALMDRQMGEMSTGMPMDDEAMGRMMGMTAEEHRRMMEEMGTLRAEVEELQVASVQELGERMPAHLDRLRAMADMLEEMAEAMREM